MDLVGTPGLGGIKVTVATDAGTQYTLTFDFSVNPYHRAGAKDEFNDTKVMQVQALGADGSTVLTVRRPSAIPPARSVPKRIWKWEQQSISFTADGGTGDADAGGGWRAVEYTGRIDHYRRSGAGR